MEEEKQLREQASKYAEKAIRLGYVALDELPFIMADDEVYISYLPDLWKEYLSGFKREMAKIETFQGRYLVWQELLYNWAFGIIRGAISRRAKDIEGIPLHSFDETTRKYEEGYIFNAVGAGPAYVKLEDLKVYLPKTIKDLPRLPLRLFPPETLKLSEMIKKLKDDPYYGDIQRAVFITFKRIGRPIEPSDINMPKEDEDSALRSTLKELIFSLYKGRLKGNKIQRQIFRELLTEAGLPLTAFWFPNDPQNTSSFVNGEKALVKAYAEIDDRIDEITRFQPRNLTEHQYQQGELEKLNRELEEIGKSVHKPDTTSLQSLIGDSSTTLPKIETTEEERANLPYPPEVLSLIRDAGPEIEMIWNGLKSIKQALLPDNYEDVGDWYKDAALRYFDSVPDGTFKTIKKEHLEEDSLYFYGDPEKQTVDIRKRDFIGKLYQILISESFPKLLPEPSKVIEQYGIKKLYEFHKSQI